MGVEVANSAFLSTIFFAIFSLYLLWASMKGNIKFGLRFFCFTFYPIKKAKTFMNAFLVNILIFNIWAISLVHFCAISFDEFARLTQIDLIFGTQIKYMRFYKYFYKYTIFPYILVGWAVITFFYLLCKPVRAMDLNKFAEQGVKRRGVLKIKDDELPRPKESNKV
jgi:LMBR1 domain-containing protein 1